MVIMYLALIHIQNFNKEAAGETTYNQEYSDDEMQTYHNEEYFASLFLYGQSQNGRDASSVNTSVVTDYEKTTVTHQSRHSLKLPLNMVNKSQSLLLESPVPIEEPKGDSELNRLSDQLMKMEICNLSAMLSDNENINMD